MEHYNGILHPSPYLIVEKSLALKPFFIIGYLHLFTLAFMSVFIFLILVELKKITFKSASSKIGLSIFLIGIFMTELLLFSQGFLYLEGLTPINNYNLWMLTFSFFMVIGLFFIFVSQFKNNQC